MHHVGLVFLAVILALAWWGKRRTALILFCIFLAAALFTLYHHMTDALSISL